MKYDTCKDKVNEAIQMALLKALKAGEDKSHYSIGWETAVLAETLSQLLKRDPRALDI